MEPTGSMESLFCVILPPPVLDLLPELLGDNTVCLLGLDWLMEEGMDTEEPIVVTVISLLWLVGLVSFSACFAEWVPGFPDSSEIHVIYLQGIVNP